MTALSDALKQANDERQLSVRDIANLGGAGLSHSTVARYLNGQHPANPDDDVLQAFSKALGLPIKWLRELAGQRVGESAPYKPPPEAHRLNARQRRAVDELIRSIVADTAVDEVAQRRGRSTRSTAPPTKGQRTIKPATGKIAAAPKQLHQDAGKRARAAQDVAGEEPQ